MSNVEASLEQILTLLQTNILPLLLSTNESILALNAESQKTMKQAQQIMTRLDPILTSITRIEDFVFALLIVLAVMLLVIFLFWFFRHVYPLMRHTHTHPHNADNVLKDLTDTPVRIQPQPTWG